MGNILVVDDEPNMRLVLKELLSEGASYADLGIEPVSSTPEQFRAHIVAEMEKWGRLIKERAAGVATSDRRCPG